MRHSDLPHSFSSSCECRMHPSTYPSASVAISFAIVNCPRCFFVDQNKIRVVSKNRCSSRVLLFPNRLPPFRRIRQTGSLARAHARNYSVSNRDRSSSSFGCQGDGIRMGGYPFRRNVMRMRGYSGHSLDALHREDEQKNELRLKLN